MTDTRDEWEDPLKKESFERFKQAWNDYPSQDNEGYQPDRGAFKCGWFACFDWLSKELKRGSEG